MMQWIKDRAQEPSSLNGAVLLLSLFGVTNADGWVQALATLAIGVSGVAEMVRRGRTWGDVFRR
jgi:hypothetical protein